MDKVVITGATGKCFICEFEGWIVTFTVYPDMHALSLCPGCCANIASFHEGMMHAEAARQGMAQ